MADPELNDHAKEIEFQTRKVAAMERFIAQMDLELAYTQEMTLVCKRAKREYGERLTQEREYLKWLNDSDEHPDG